jgi:DNA polymerase-3 subunit alpha
MINLRVKTEYSFRHAYGKIKDVIASQGEYAAITDRNNTFGHIPFWNECKKQGKKPILGVELGLVQDVNLKVRQTTYYITLIAKNQQGLSSLYKLVSLSTKQENHLALDSISEIDENIIIIIQDHQVSKYLNGRSAYYGISPMSNFGDFKKNKLPTVAISDNLYNKEEDRPLYEVILGMGVGFSKCETRTELSHVLNEEEWKSELYWLDEEDKTKAINRTFEIASSIETFDFTQAELPKSKSEMSLKELCLLGAAKRGMNILEMPEYLERVNREINVIQEKEFEDYFFLVADLVDYAKQHMLVGPARGSSAGSLVCYLIGITEVDPLKFGLLFERFIDINRGGYKMEPLFIKSLTNS